ncbi:hypothetical protein C8Q80DRAFT_21107 [Daedaleopsis nitida]|nr:hypothetical protein C8Q80DRAFT_21107 [Daedaleopsis nitida]
MSVSLRLPWTGRLIPSHVIFPLAPYTMMIAQPPPHDIHHSHIHATSRPPHDSLYIYIFPAPSPLTSSNTPPTARTVRQSSRLASLFSSSRLSSRPSDTTLSSRCWISPRTLSSLLHLFDYRYYNRSGPVEGAQEGRGRRVWSAVQAGGWLWSLESGGCGLANGGRARRALRCRWWVGRCWSRSLDGGDGDVVGQARYHRCILYCAHPSSYRISSV